MGDLDATEFDRWQAQAESALAAARTLADEQPAWACFCCEQAAQLAVKGLLHAAGLEAWGHDLVTLELRLREALGDAWAAGEIGGEILRLSRFYVATRCPDAHPGGVPATRYASADADTALADAETILRAVDDAWERLAEDR